MKNNFIGMIALCAVLLLTACSGTAATSTASAASTGEALNESYPNALSIEQQLALGTLKLEESATPIDSQTAGELLPLWKAVRSLSTDDTTSELEMQALYSQIEETLSTAQVQAIAAMQLTAADWSQELASLEPATTESSSAASTTTTKSAGGPGGDQMQPQDVNVGMSNASGGGQPAAMAAAATTPQKTGSDSTAAANDISTAVVNAVITLLEGKA